MTPKIPGCFLGLMALTCSNAGAQCTGVATIDLRDLFIATAPGSGNTAQDPRAAFTFRRGSETGPLLIGETFPSSTVGWWASPGFAYSIPAYGPLYSRDDAENQAIWDRRPEFDGTFTHPGNVDVAEDLYLVFEAPGPVSLVRHSGSAEVLGNVSNGVVIRITARIGESDITLIDPFMVPYTTTGRTLFGIPLDELPIDFNTGDKFIVRIGNNGSPFEDWLNFHMFFMFRGVPLILAEPVPAPVCSGAEAMLHVEARASVTTTFQWQQEVNNVFVNLADGPQSTGAVVGGSDTDTLYIADTAETEDTRYRCVMTNECGTTITTPVRLVVCTQDFDCDGFVSGADFDAFVQSYEAGENRADYDQDGFITGIDYDLFVQSFEEGC